VFLYIKNRSVQVAWGTTLPERATTLLRLEEARADIGVRGRFSTKAREKLLARYDRALDDLRTRINKRGKR
jgi:hypothetical protein